MSIFLSIINCHQSRVQHLRRRVLRGTTVTRLRLRHPPPIGRSVHPVRLVLAVATPSSRGSTSLIRFHPVGPHILLQLVAAGSFDLMIDRKSTRLNSSHVAISYAVFCLKKKK